MKTNWLDYTLLTLVIIGAVNWGLIGFFRFDLVAFLFGDLSWLSRVVYALVGIGGLYMISRYSEGSDPAGTICRKIGFILFLCNNKSGVLSKLA